MLNRNKLSARLWIHRLAVSRLPTISSALLISSSLYCAIDSHLYSRIGFSRSHCHLNIDTASPKTRRSTHFIRVEPGTRTSRAQIPIDPIEWQIHNIGWRFSQTVLVLSCKVELSSVSWHSYSKVSLEKVSETCTSCRNAFAKRVNKGLVVQQVRLVDLALHQSSA